MDRALRSPVPRSVDGEARLEAVALEGHDEAIGAGPVTPQGLAPGTRAQPLCVLAVCAGLRAHHRELAPGGVEDPDIQRSRAVPWAGLALAGLFEQLVNRPARCVQLQVQQPV